MAKDDPALNKAKRELEKAKRQMVEGASTTPEEPEGNEPEAPQEEQLELDLNDARTEAEEQVVPDQTSDEDESAKLLAEKDAKIEELTRRINAEDGARGGEMQRLRQQNASLEDQVRALSQSVEQLNNTSDSAETGKIPDGAFKGISEDELAGYDESALNVIVKVAENISAMQDRGPDVSKDVEALKEREAIRDFTLAAERLAPGFLKVNGDSLMGIPPSKDWLEFLNTPIDPDLPDETWGEVAQRVGTPEAAATVFKKFQLMRQPDRAPAKVSDAESDNRPSLEGQVVPSKSASSPKVPESKDKEVLSRSEYERFMREASKPGMYTQETRDKLRAYHLAELEGRLK